MSYSKMVTHVRLSPNCSRPRNHKIDTITIHHAAGNASVEAMGALFAAKSRQASANYGVGTDGRVACYVEEENRAFTSSNAGNDHRAVTIEVANDGGAPDWHVSDKALAATIDLCADICQRNGIERLNYTGDKTGNLTMHKWFAATACPGPYLGGKFPYIAAEVNRRLGNAPAPEKAPENKPEKPTEKKEEGYTMNMRNLSKGCKGEDVRALQILLIGRGYTCGSYGADGDFGNATDTAVRNYQRDKALGVDGIAGPATMGSLLGV